MDKYYQILGKVLSSGKMQSNKKGNIRYLLNEQLTLLPADLLDIFEGHTIARKKLKNELQLFMRGERNVEKYSTRPTKEQYQAATGAEDTSGYNDWLDAEGYNDISPIKGIFKSFSDAPGGFKEELQEIQWSLGVEYTYHNQFSVRGGYHYEHENKGNRKYFSFGAGFKMSVFSLDAAYLISTAQSNPLDQTLRFTLGFDLDGIRDLFGRRR